MCCFLNVHFKGQRVKQIWSFSTDFHKSPLWNFMVVPPVGAELMHAEGWTDRRTGRHMDMAKLVEALTIMPSRLRMEEGVTD